MFFYFKDLTSFTLYKPIWEKRDFTSPHYLVRLTPLRYMTCITYHTSKFLFLSLETVYQYHVEESTNFIFTVCFALHLQNFIYWAGKCFTLKMLSILIYGRTNIVNFANTVFYFNMSNFSCNDLDWYEQSKDN